MMKLSGSWCVLIVGLPLLIISAGILHLAEAADGTNEFRRCYNTSVEMHCFDLQYDTTNNRWLTATNDNARQRCNNLNSTLLIIKDEATNNIIRNYIADPSSPIGLQYVWTDAYRINDYNNSYTWHWLNSKLPYVKASEASYLYDYKSYVTTLEYRSDDGNPSQFHLTAKLPQYTYNYVCEYEVSRCSPAGSNVFQFADRCYISFSASVSWYEARNRCLKDGGDLGSFSNFTSINFTSWLGSVPYAGYWIGLRFSWYIWKDSGDDVKFSKWTANSLDWGSPCLIVCFNCDPSYSWLAKDCNIADSIYVVCHKVTSLQAPTTLTTPRPTTPPITTSADRPITTQTETTQPNNTGSNSSPVEKSPGSQTIGVAVGVGVGVGVPVIVAIIVIVICVVRKHRSKTQGSTTTRQESRDETSHTEYQNNNGEDSEVNHYAIVHPSSPPKMVEQEPSSEPQYAILGFNESADRKNDSGHFPLNVL